jgi:hypothetical protein
MFAEPTPESVMNCGCISFCFVRSRRGERPGAAEEEGMDPDYSIEDRAMEECPHDLISCVDCGRPFAYARGDVVPEQRTGTQNAMIYATMTFGSAVEAARPGGAAPEQETP